jgi:hypothetical protein
MESLEGGISHIQTSLAKLGSERLSIMASTHSSSQFTTTSATGTSSSQPTISQLSIRQPGHRHIFQIGDTYERYVGPTSLQSLMLDVKEFVMDPLCGEGIKAEQAANSARDSLNALIECENGSESVYDDSPPAMPPLAILEAMVEPYFDLVSPRLPIWTYQGFRRLIEASQSPGNSKQDYVCAVCFNNMILLALTAKSLLVESRKPMQSTARQRSSSMEQDLLRPFVANARRAMNKIEQLLSPSPANIQAFLSLVCNSFNRDGDCITVGLHFST